MGVLILKERLMSKLIVANWKMNGSLSKVKSDLESYNSNPVTNNANVVLTLPMPYLSIASSIVDKQKLAAQDLSRFDGYGAYTGEVSASMLKDLNMAYALVGHSERRNILDESDDLLIKKVENLINHQITPIFCIGESLKVRQENEYFKFISNQLSFLVPALDKLSNLVIAYEPIWSIGTGVIPTNQQIAQMMDYIHSFMQKCANHVKMATLYGGSVTSDNAKSILSTSLVDGVLVGGASLKVNEFMAICSSSK